MLKIIINNYIASESEKMAFIMNGEGYQTSYYDVQGMLDYFPEEQEVLVELHSCGGDTTEGWAIYDALRASGRTIYTKVVGECASMATVIFLAAPKERRTIAKHAKMLIHSPYFPDAGVVHRGNIGALSAALEEEHNKMLNVYIERTGMDKETLEAQMEQGGWFDAEKAVELGFAGAIEPELSASVNSNNKFKSMKKGKFVAEVEKFLAELGIKTSAVVLTTKDGGEIEVDRDDNNVEVGDKAKPDGEFELSDGRIIIVKDGEVIEIKEAEEDVEEPEETPEVTAEESEEVQKLKDENEQLKKVIEELKKQLSEQEEVVAAVASLGGKKWLAAQTSEQPGFVRQQAKKVKEENNPYAEILAAKRNSIKNRKK